MPQIPADVQQMIEIQIASGRYASADEVLRDAMTLLARDQATDIDVVERGIALWKSGVDEGMGVDEAFDRARDEIRRRTSQ